MYVSRMSTYTWDDIERPILEAFREAEVDGTDRMARAAAATPEISPERRTDSVVALHEAGYVEAQVSQNAGGSKWLMSVGSLTEKGRRAVGQWPSDDVVATYSICSTGRWSLPLTTRLAFAGNRCVTR